MLMSVLSDDEAGNGLGVWHRVDAECEPALAMVACKGPVFRHASMDASVPTQS